MVNAVDKKCSLPWFRMATKSPRVRSRLPIVFDRFDTRRGGGYGTTAEELAVLSGDLGNRKEAGDLQNVWRRKGRTLSLPDVTLAAVALSNGLILVTANGKDFPKPDLQTQILEG